MKKRSLGRWMFLGLATVVVGVLVFMLGTPVPYELKNERGSRGVSEMQVMRYLDELGLELSTERFENSDDEYMYADLVWRGVPFEIKLEYPNHRKKAIRWESLLTAVPQNARGYRSGGMLSYRRSGDFISIVSCRPGVAGNRDAAEELAEVIHAKVLEKCVVTYRPRGLDIWEKAALRVEEMWDEVSDVWRDFRYRVRKAWEAR